jgi:hypothetical protein
MLWRFFQKIIPCHYCSYQGKSENEILIHSINAHPAKPADETIIILEKEEKEKQDNKTYQQNLLD